MRQRNQERLGDNPMTYNLAKPNDVFDKCGYTLKLRWWRKRIWAGKMVWMAPTKFLGLAWPLVPEVIRAESLEYVYNRMTHGLPLDPVSLSIDPTRGKVIEHEGRHRATVAMCLDIESVPVVMKVYAWNEDVSKWAQSQHDYIDKGEFRPEMEFDSDGELVERMDADSFFQKCKRLAA